MLERPSDQELTALSPLKPSNLQKKRPNLPSLMGMSNFRKIYVWLWLGLNKLSISVAQRPSPPPLNSKTSRVGIQLKTQYFHFGAQHLPRRWGIATHRNLRNG